ncbi:tRNA (adenosine(37)-N6)-threonylcarbamoyltransferase complex ATPase subunit type 1 TsaE [Ruminococcaceae bacterium OttesenSCG-928-A16]|nr:tRNA (adenosine(37)-N6)-threonylcarbamoyltransferase complex ATPase subunit type 1 TsaE [Ruminococcaceae bacterium OttesenSCG-928-A16]
MGQYITNSAQQTAALGEKLAAHLHGGETVAFTGGLGVGKTTFCSGLAKGLGVTDTPSSPTFAIVNYYRGRQPMAHFDAYRIATLADLETAGFYDYLDQGAVVAVEWSENIAPFLEEPLVQVAIKQLSENQRSITILGVDGL